MILTPSFDFLALRTEANHAHAPQVAAVVRPRERRARVHAQRAQGEVDVRPRREREIDETPAVTRPVNRVY
eukprot:31265-Pelagococcus_subviridis.AAC.31